MVFKGQDAWRSHPLLINGWKRPFPGIGLAVGIFTVYVVAEQAYKRMSDCKKALICSPFLILFAF
jgi:hypothetical protein